VLAVTSDGRGTTGVAGNGAVIGHLDIEELPLEVRIEISRWNPREKSRRCPSPPRRAEFVRLQVFPDSRPVSVAVPECLQDELVELLLLEHIGEQIDATSERLRHAEQVSIVSVRDGDRVAGAPFLEEALGGEGPSASQRAEAVNVV